MSEFPELKLTRDGHVCRVQMCRPPDNFFDLSLLTQLAECLEQLDAELECRAIILASQGKCFCAGGRLIEQADAAHSPLQGEDGNSPLYRLAVRLFRIATPIVAGVQGPAIGGGLGLSLVADFRIASPAARFAGNFVKLGLHPGFGISHTLPRVIGSQKAGLMLLTGRRIKAQQALQWGLVDELVEPAQLAPTAMALAQEIAEGAPLATQSTRATHRQGLAEAVEAATRHEFSEQSRLAAMPDFAEGLRAVAERRRGQFSGRQ